jgi:hypothetical protein
MECAQCEQPSAEVIGVTDDARTQLRCKECGFEWTHGPSAEDLRAGKTGGTKYFCPVCEHIYTDPTTPIVTIGSPNNLAHRCDRTRSYQLGPRYGLNEAAINDVLKSLDDNALANWPLVREMKQERLGESAPEGAQAT